MKRLVKQWLKEQLGDDFQDCLMTITSGDKDNHQTYGISNDLMPSFKIWGKEQLQRMKLFSE